MAEACASYPSTPLRGVPLPIFDGEDISPSSWLRPSTQKRAQWGWLRATSRVEPASVGPSANCGS